MDASNTSDPDSSVEKNPFLWSVFNSFIDNAVTTASEEDLTKYITEELKINVNELCDTLVENLPFILIAFMNSWTGWNFRKEFYAGRFKKEYYFARFRKFLSWKMHTFLKRTRAGAKPQSLAEILASSLQKNDKKEAESPYAISIKCPAYFLNTLVFTNKGDDIIMKQHLAHQWQDLSTMQLINWPYVEVKFCIQDIYFVRRQATSFERHLNFQLNEQCKNANHSVIESAERVCTHSCFTNKFIEEYFKEYISSLKGKVEPTKMEEISTILSQFLEDIKYININNSIATSTWVRFRLCRHPFIRNKKLITAASKEQDDYRVGYCESVTPKIEIILVHFNPKQKNTPNIRFEYTDKLKRMTRKSSDLLLPQIQYKCTFCNITFGRFNSKEEIVSHLKKDHEVEPHVRCTGCKKQFNVLNLAACRWKHKCVANRTTTNNCV